jgi:CheY-like chemotaxis protein
MIIDDRKEILRIRKAALESLGYAVLWETTSQGAIRKLQHHQVDAVLIEYKQEGVDAEAVAFHLKAHAPMVPIVLLSAYSDMPERMLWLVDEFVFKSASPEQLSVAIERSFAQRPPTKPVVSEKGNSRGLGATA